MKLINIHAQADQHGSVGSPRGIPGCGREHADSQHYELATVSCQYLSPIIVTAWVSTDQIYIPEQGTASPKIKRFTNEGLLLFFDPFVTTRLGGPGVM